VAQDEGLEFKPQYRKKKNKNKKQQQQQKTGWGWGMVGLGGSWKEKKSLSLFQFKRPYLEKKHHTHIKKGWWSGSRCRP
jgi:hypothetical protein